ncbi:MAG: glycoside hydrolase, partial [Ruthenibacterium sp.]
MKMALIGGGGVRTVFFCQSLAKYADRLGITELRLMDNDAEKLNMFGRLAQFAVSQSSNLKITLTESIEEAVSAVDYVVTALRVGGDAGRVKDERVALSLGVLGQETTGAGGFSYAMRTIPVLKEYMRIINEKSNHATVFNFTNPAGLVTQALHLAGYHNTIGICDNATGTKMNLAQALNVDARDLFVRVYGLNHLTWADSITVRGAEIFPQLMANEQFIQNYHDFLYYDRDLVRKLNALPNGYLYYYYHRERALANILAAKQTRGESILALNREMVKKLCAVDIEKNPQRALDIYLATMDARNATYMATELGGKAAVKIPLDIESLGIDALKGAKGQMEVLEGYAGVALNYIEAQ